MKINDFSCDLTDISAKKEALTPGGEALSAGMSRYLVPLIERPPIRRPN